MSGRAKPPAPPSAVEDVAPCGAPTLKGTPCKLPGRYNGRCWRHAGEGGAKPEPTAETPHGSEAPAAPADPATEAQELDLSDDFPDDADDSAYLTATAGHPSAWTASSQDGELSFDILDDPDGNRYVSEMELEIDAELPDTVAGDVELSLDLIDDVAGPPLSSRVGPDDGEAAMHDHSENGLPATSSEDLDEEAAATLLDDIPDGELPFDLIDDDGVGAPAEVPPSDLPSASSLDHLPDGELPFDLVSDSDDAYSLDASALPPPDADPGSDGLGDFMDGSGDDVPLDRPLPDRTADTPSDDGRDTAPDDPDGALAPIDVITPRFTRQVLEDGALFLDDTEAFGGESQAALPESAPAPVETDTDAGAAEDADTAGQPPTAQAGGAGDNALETPAEGADDIMPPVDPSSPGGGGVPDDAAAGTRPGHAHADADQEPGTDSGAMPPVDRRVAPPSAAPVELKVPPPPEPVDPPDDLVGKPFVAFTVIVAAALTILILSAILMSLLGI